MYFPISQLHWVSVPSLARLHRFFVASCLVASSSQASTAPPPAEVFGALPAETQPALSPDAHWIAWLDQTENKPHIVIFDLEARRIQRIGALPQQMSLRSLQWSDDETLLATASAVGAPRVATGRATASFTTLSMKPTGEGALRLPSFKADSRPADIISAIHAGMVRASTTKPHTIIMFSGPSLLEVNTNTGDSERIKLGNEHTVYWAVDRDGKPVAREDWDWKTGSYRLYALKGDGIKEILRNDDKHAPTLMGVLPDDSGLVLLANNGHTHQCAWGASIGRFPAKALGRGPGGGHHRNLHRSLYRRDRGFLRIRNEDEHPMARSRSTTSPRGAAALLSESASRGLRLVARRKQDPRPCPISEFAPDLLPDRFHRPAVPKSPRKNTRSSRE